MPVYVQYIVCMESRESAKGRPAEIRKCQETDHVPPERTTIVLDPKEADRFLAALDDPASFEAGLGALTERPSVIEQAASTLQAGVMTCPPTYPQFQYRVLLCG